MSTKEFSDQTSRMLTNIILPCYLFTQMMNNIRIANIKDIFQCLIGCLIVIIVGIILGLISAKLLVNQKRQILFLTAAFSTSDSAAFLIILAQICGPFLDQMQPPKTGELPAGQRALYYIVLITVINNFWKWTFCYLMVQNEEGEEEISKDYKKISDKENEMVNLNNENENNPNIEDDKVLRKQVFFWHFQPVQDFSDDECF